MTSPALADSLLDLTRAELTELLADWNQPRFRADQVWEWLYKKLATDPAEMTNLPKALRERLAAETQVDPLARVYEQRSGDGQTVKWLFRLHDGLTIETVLMLYDDVSGSTRERRTVCISTQAGCAMGCVFCATGQAGLARNLTAGEIVAQVLAAARWLVADDRPLTIDHHPSSTPHLRPPQVGAGVVLRPLTNIVVMGMGEPMANYDRTWEAVRTITDPDAFGLGARHVTVSTVGLPQGIRRMAGEPLQINLAVSLHAPNDALRSKLLPVNLRFPIHDVMTAIQDYIDSYQPAGNVRVRADGQDQRYRSAGKGTGNTAQAAAQPDGRGHVPRQPDPTEPGRRVTLPTIHP